MSTFCVIINKVYLSIKYLKIKNMKRILLAISCIPFVLLNSCSFDDVLEVKEAITEGTLTKETVPLIGQWQLESAVLGNGIDVTNECFMEEIIEFRIDGTYLDRRNQINPESGECEMVGEFERGYSTTGGIFETPANETQIATYQLSNNNNTVILYFTIPFVATVTYKRVK